MKRFINFLLIQILKSFADYCLYTRYTKAFTTIIIVWVDDLIFASSSTADLKKVKLSLAERFKMKDLGTLSWFLGIEFDVSDGLITMSQSKCIDKMSRFNMSECHSKLLPCDSAAANMKVSVSIC